MARDRSLPRRRSVHLPGYDYGQPGAYFVTLCTHNRSCILAEMGCKGLLLRLAGRIVEQEWLRTCELRSRVAADRFVIMPNHFHAIVWIENDAGTARRAPTGERFSRPVADSLPTIVRAFKSATTRAIRRLWGEPGVRVWQRGFYEHVIRGEKSLGALRKYIADNPLNWTLDSENPAKPRMQKGGDDSHIST